MNKLFLGLLASSALIPSAALAQTSPSDFTTGHRYDALRREVGTISPDPDGAGPLHYAAVRNTYDAAGRLIKVEKGELVAWQSEAIAPASWSGFTVHNQVDTVYDALDRKVRESVSSGGVTYSLTQYSYDAAGRLECTAVRMNPAAYGSLPTSACTLGTQGSQGADRITKNVYDAADQLLQVRKAVGTNREQAYATYAYTDNGKQQFVIDANGNKAQLTYDGHDRQVGWHFPSTTPPSSFNPATVSSAYSTAGAVSSTDFEGYGYDANGNRTTLRKRDGRTFTYTYDTLNRMTSKIVPDACVSGYACTNVPVSMTRDVYYSYDLRGLQTAARFDNASGVDAVTSAYDGFGRLISSTTSMGGVSRTLGYLYDADGNRTRITHPDGSAFTYSYDGLNRLSGVYEGASTSVWMVQYSYDAQGRIGGRGERYGSGQSYGYDAISRLASLSDDFAGSGGDNAKTFGYNPASQITSRAQSNDAYAFTAYSNTNRGYTVNGLNQYATVGGNSYGYDSNGNLTSDGGIAYTYDAENRLVVTSTGAQLSYDPLGRLYETYKASTGTTRFLYDGDQLTAEYDGAGTMLRRYVHGLGEDDPLLWYEGPTIGPARWLHADHQGSVVAIADSSASVSSIYSYDEYGVPGGSYAGRFQYTGQAWIPELGMYYYKARIYSPMLGRFLQTDPIGYEDQINLYAYVGNDPVNGKDPTGLDGDCDWCKKVSDVVQSINKEIQPTRVAARVISLIPGNNDSVDTIQSDIATALSNPVDTISEVAPAFIGSGVPGADPAVRAPNTARSGGPYSNLPDSRSIGPGKNFTASQKAKIYQQNREANGGVLRSDLSGEALVPPSKSVRGVRPPANEAQIDHITPRTPRAPGASAGSNSFRNAQVLSREENRAKSNN